MLGQRSTIGLVALPLASVTCVHFLDALSARADRDSHQNQEVERSMQLSALLARLTPEERSVLLERRLGENTVALDNQALTNQLVQPVSLRLALAELNVGQLLLLRWLGTRPNLEATWAELLAALGDRLTPGLRDAYLLDLRLWGLADYHPTQRGGFFATYPAVVAHLPNPRGIKLRQRLQDTATDYLAQDRQRPRPEATRRQRRTAASS